MGEIKLGTVGYRTGPSKVRAEGNGYESGVVDL